MKITVCLFVISSFLIELGYAQKHGSEQLSKISWLKGKWERTNTKPGQAAFEKWTKTSDSFKGEGISMRGKDTVFVEKLSIREKDETLYYVAEVNENAEPTYFKITEITESGFICENPDHDFPQKIVYQLESSEQLKATISGGGKSISFIFQRVRE